MHLLPSPVVAPPAPRRHILHAAHQRAHQLMILRLTEEWTIRYAANVLHTVDTPTHLVFSRARALALLVDLPCLSPLSSTTTTSRRRHQQQSRIHARPFAASVEDALPAYPHARRQMARTQLGNGQRPRRASQRLASLPRHSYTVTYDSLGRCPPCPTPRTPYSPPQRAYTPHADTPLITL